MRTTYRIAGLAHDVYTKARAFGLNLSTCTSDATTTYSVDRPASLGMKEISFEYDHTDGVVGFIEGFAAMVALATA